jgi:hypothetical protein
MSEMGHFRKSARASATSDLPPTTTSRVRAITSEKCQNRKWIGLFNHPVGTGEKRSLL